MTQRFLPYTPERDVYRLLGVDAAAGTDELLDAWRRLARTFHPDRNSSGRAHEEMQIVNAVRELVTDPQARETYDRERRRWLSRGFTAAPRGNAPTSSRTDRSVDRAPSEVERIGRALLAGARAFAVELLPARCARCAAAVGRSEARCWVCGGPTRVARRGGSAAG